MTTNQAIAIQSGAVHHATLPEQDLEKRKPQWWLGLSLNNGCISYENKKRDNEKIVNQERKIVKMERADKIAITIAVIAVLSLIGHLWLVSTEMDSVRYDETLEQYPTTKPLRY